MALSPGLGGAAGVCNLPPDPAQTQYIVGYGSLMQEESRRRTAPTARVAYPVILKGYRRGWFAKGSPVGFGSISLGVVADENSQLNAAIFEIDPAEIPATDQREYFYCREGLDAARIAPLAAEALAPAGQIWIYAMKPGAVATPSSRYPIVQSYVDIFVSGCLEHEQRFALEGFAAQCLTTTQWSHHWVNDRIYPRRPFIYQHRAREIDRLLADQLPQFFSSIRIESGQ
jgi:hypothetical protein